MKSSNELAKTTPAGEYLTSALADFDPNHFEGFAAIADGANKLLMLVSCANLTKSVCLDLEEFCSLVKLVWHIPFHCCFIMTVYVD